jgi:sugar/nucleoside kinase (ribokinase family)
VKQNLSYKQFIKETVTFLEDKIEEFKVVVMPDFFLDRVVKLNLPFEEFSKNLRAIAERKGGSIDKVKQMEIRGGNAINTASALISLGAKVTPIVCTNTRGLQLIKFYLKSSKVNLSNIKILDRMSMTTSLEMETKNGIANVMLRDVGSLEEFGPKNLDSKDFETLEAADYVCVFNWAGTKRFGTELAKTVFRYTKAKGNGKTYYDTADPTPNKEKIPELVKEVLMSKNVDILSVNENEAICYASCISPEINRMRKKLRLEELAKESAKILASHFSARIDLHTTVFSATFTKNREETVPAFKIPVSRTTGAGDAWNAGNILGDAYELPDKCRLTLANAVAAYYISNSEGKHPTRKKLIEFLKKLYSS